MCVAFGCWIGSTDNPEPLQGLIRSLRRPYGGMLGARSVWCALGRPRPELGRARVELKSREERRKGDRKKC